MTDLSLHRDDAIEQPLDDIDALFHDVDGNSGVEIKTVLARLNERTRHRFTGIYRFEDRVLRNLCLFDRENPMLEVSGETAMLEETFCAIIDGSGVPFWTHDSRIDARVSDHPGRFRVVSYAGVPLHDDDAGVSGTLCHFDSRPRLLSPSEISFLAAVAPRLGRFLGLEGCR